MLRAICCRVARRLLPLALLGLLSCGSTSPSSPDRLAVLFVGNSLKIGRAHV